MQDDDVRVAAIVAGLTSAIASLEIPIQECGTRVIEHLTGRILALYETLGPVMQRALDHAGINLPFEGDNGGR